MASILIVDDSIVMRKNLATIITKAGHTIAGEASNGKQAIAQYTELKPDIVTMDISMPIMSGVEAVKQIIKLDQNAKIIMVSAVNQKKMVFNAINSGAKHYVIKPIDTNKVISIINEVLDEETQNQAIEVIDSREQIQGFQIENIDGSFVITFNKHIDASDHKFLDMAIRGIMFIKPLKVTMDFSAISSVPPSVLGPVIGLATEIEEMDGLVTFKTDSVEMNKIISEWK
jgi:YesN/AraC family two-component response regulator